VSERVKEVRAAGGLLWEMVFGELKVLVAHRPYYDDWSFPKGKHDPGETDLECAQREVREETGFDVVVGEPLPDVDYIDHKGRPKSVAYWAMERADAVSVFQPNDEVDQILWLAVDAALARLTYELDRHLLREFLLLRNGPT
jgi:8-oxo-(d)GTP phosphatase